MKRLLFALIALAVAAVALPPLWYRVFPGDPPPELPPPGRRVAVASGVDVNVLDAGSGAPVVMVHGLPGSAYDWRELSAQLSARGRRAIAYDRVGYGRSDPRRDGRYTPWANAEELVALLEALDLRDATVVGWSYGGVTAMIAAVEQPERVGRLVLVGTGGPDSPDARPPELPAFMRFLNSEPVLRWRRAVPPVSIGLMEVLSAQAYSGGPQPDWWLPGLRANFARWETIDTYRMEMAGVGVGDGEQLAPERIALPTLILHGDADRLAPVAIARYLDGVIPGSQLVEFPGGSHMLPITHAADLADRIVAFIDAHP